MAEYRTYTCDICKKHEAKRFTFPMVDREPDPSGGRDTNTTGHVDLCLEHTQRIMDHLLKNTTTIEMQRAAWKGIMGK